jgi:DNA polymerase family B
LSLYAFDTETVDGEPLTIQFAGQEGVVLYRTSRSTILEIFLTFLAQHGVPDNLNLLWAHNLEFDAGVVFSEASPDLWAYQTPHFVGEVDGMGQVEIVFHHTDNPFHQFTIQGRQWWLLDTMSFFKLSLEEACRRLRLPVRKLPRPPYLGERPPTEDEWPEFEAYAGNDARATYELAVWILERHREFGIPPTVSIAHMAGTVFRCHFLGEDLGRAVRTRAMTVPADIIQAKGPRLRERLRVRIDPPLPWPDAGPSGDRLLKASLLSFHGGKNGLYVPPGVYFGVTEVDIISAYPAAMRALPPLTKGQFLETSELVKERCGIYHVVGRVRDRCSYGVFLTVEGDRITEGRFDTWVTSYEFESAHDEIELESVEGVYWEPAAGATNPLAVYVDVFFAKKQQTPKDDPRREMYKLLLNALYGKLIQLVDKEEPMLADLWVQAGSLFHPFWASMITGHCRARLHALEHAYRALHASTDSILTQAPTIQTGTGLGELEIKARGTLVILRPRLYVILGADGQVLREARHGFRGSAEDLLALIRRGGGPYTVDHMVKPREALRTKDKPFRMTLRSYEVKGVPADVWTAAAAYLNRAGAEGGSR